MLGYTDAQNWVYAFFEDGEIERLANSVIEGSYININNPEFIGRLEARRNDEYCRKRFEKISTDVKKENGIVTEMRIFLSDRIYDDLCTCGKVDNHQGYRHVILKNASDMNVNEARTLADLKACAAKYAKK